MDVRTEGIDYESEFFWLDEYPINSAKEEQRNRCKPIVDLSRENELKNIKAWLLSILLG